MTVCSRPVYLAFVVMVTGVCLLAKTPTAQAIADRLGVVSHDALTRMLTHSCWTASFLMEALLNQALLSHRVVFEQLTNPVHPAVICGELK